jgi:hypothetical protein
VNLKGIAHDVIKVPSLHLPVGSEEKHGGAGEKKRCPGRDSNRLPL